jgi:PIN like domain
VEFFADRNLGKEFPLRLRAAGLTVHLHDDHFAPDADDEEWAPYVSGRGWIALSRDRRIRTTVVEYDAVMFAAGRLLVMTGGSMKTDLLAMNFLNTLAKIERVVGGQPAPFIAMVYRPSPVESILKGAPGSVKVVLTVSEWERKRRRRFPIPGLRESGE